MKAPELLLTPPKTYIQLGGTQATMRGVCRGVAVAVAVSLLATGCSLLLAEDSGQQQGDAGASDGRSPDAAVPCAACESSETCFEDICRLECSSDAMCGTGLCDLRNGVCFDVDEVVFVSNDGQGGPSCGDLAATDPMQEPCLLIADGLMAARTLGRPIVRIRAGSELVESIRFSEAPPVRVLGYDATVIGATGPAVSAVRGSQASVEGLLIRGGEVADNSHGVHVLNGGALALYRVRIENHQRAGIAAEAFNPADTASSRIDVESSVINNNGLATTPGAAVAITNVQFSVRNTVISANGGRGFQFGVSGVSGAVVFAFNTVLKNASDAAFCGQPSMGGRIFIGNIFMENATNCIGAFDYSWVPNDIARSNLLVAPMLANPDEGLYQLVDGSAGLNIDALGEYGSSGDVDADGNARPNEGAYDVGAFEYYEN